MTNNFRSLNKRGLTNFGYKIFLDRYSLKDTTRQTLQPGDLVLIKTDDNTGQKEIAEVVELNGDYADVIVHPATDDAQWQPIAIDHIDKPLELDPADMWQRVALAMSEYEVEKQTWYERFHWLLEDWKFLPGGRILAAAGTDTELTYYNCYVLPSPHDSKAGIFKTLDQMAQIMARGGGVGINISTLRPKYAYAKSTNGRSSGAVSWGELYSYTTGLIEQGGSRRGALMLILNDWHPDVLEFINSKRDMKRILNANISVGVSDKLMQAAENDEDWPLIFPDTTHPAYDTEWDGDICKWVANYGESALKSWKVIKARELWNAIIDSAWASAEPGIWFIDRANKFSNSQYYAPLIATNPCAEQPLPAWSVCLLGSINLSKFIHNTPDDGWRMDWEMLEQAVRYAVRFMDNVIDATPYVYPEIEKQQKSERRIGLGTMGLAEVLIKLQLRYGSKESLKFIDELYKFIAIAAYYESNKLAIEKGAFPLFDAEQIMRSKFMLQLPLDLGERIINTGLRNVTLLTQAPTGTIGTMVNTSTGIEPFYFWEYERKGQLGSHIERVKVYEEWLCRKDAPPDDDEPLPSWFVTAQDLTPEEHIYVQAAIQRWVDSSISKTCNLPNHYTPQQVGDIYRLLYDSGCKGGTVYRDGSRNVQVLNLKDNTSVQDKTHSGGEEHDPTQSVKWRKRPANLTGTSYRKATPVGTAYVAVNDNGTKEPFEVFVTVGKAGSDVAADAEGLGRLISLILRMPSPLSVKERIENIVAQLSGIGSGRAQGFGPNRVMSLPDAVAQVLGERAELAGELPKLPEYELEQPKTMYYNGNADICPNCGNASLMRVEGCSKCHGCGYSAC